MTFFSFVSLNGKNGEKLDERQKQRDDADVDVSTSLNEDPTATKDVPADTSSSNSTQKIIYAVRHGSSDSNEHMELEGNRWGDPTFRDNLKWHDSPLSDRGLQEAARLAHRLQHDPACTSWLQEVEIIVVSPLTRCLMTYDLGVRPALVALEKKVPVVVLPLITERVYVSYQRSNSRNIISDMFLIS